MLQPVAGWGWGGWGRLLARGIGIRRAPPTALDPHDTRPQDTRTPPQLMSCLWNSVLPRRDRNPRLRLQPPRHGGHQQGVPERPPTGCTLLLTPPHWPCNPPGVSQWSCIERIGTQTVHSKPQAPFHAPTVRGLVVGIYHDAIPTAVHGGKRIAPCAPRPDLPPKWDTMGLCAWGCLSTVCTAPVMLATLPGLLQAPASSHHYFAGRALRTITRQPRLYCPDTTRFAQNPRHTSNPLLSPDRDVIAFCVPASSANAHLHGSLVRLPAQ